MGEKQDELEQLEEEYTIEKKQLRELEEKLEVCCDCIIYYIVSSAATPLMSCFVDIDNRV